MSSFSLEVKDWVDWSVEQRFDTQQEAIAHALSNFPHNEWRVSFGTRVVYEDNGLERDAQSDLRRFQNVQDFTVRKADEIRRANEARQRREAQAITIIDSIRRSLQMSELSRNVNWKEEGF